MDSNNRIVPVASTSVARNASFGRSHLRIAVTLGDFTVAAAADNFEDVAGSRRRKAIVARGFGGGAVGACVGGLAGWRWGQFGRRKAVAAPINSTGVGRSFM